MYDGAHERYVADEEMRDKVRVALTKSRLPVLPIVQSNYSYTWPERLTLFWQNSSSGKTTRRRFGTCCGECWKRRGGECGTRMTKPWRN